jgi:hypothetical protein
MEDDEEIVVTGKLDTHKLNLYMLESMLRSLEGGVPGSSGGGGSGGTGSGGPDDPSITTLHFSVPDLNLDVAILLSEWSLLSDKQKYVILQTLANYKSDPGLKGAFDHLVAEQVSSVRITVGSSAVDNNGNLFSFPPGAMMAVSYISENGDTTRTNIVAGTAVIISINSNHSNFTSDNMMQFATAFIHEIMHPITPDIFIDPSNGRLTDHPTLNGTGGYNGTVATAVTGVYGNIDWSITLPPVVNGVSGNTPDPPEGPPQNDEPIGSRTAPKLMDSFEVWASESQGDFADVGVHDSLPPVEISISDLLADDASGEVTITPVYAVLEQVQEWQFPHGDYLVV